LRRCCCQPYLKRKPSEFGVLVLAFKLASPNQFLVV
jgi:hypothetical protein